VENRARSIVARFGPTAQATSVSTASGSFSILDAAMRRRPRYSAPAWWFQVHILGKHSEGNFPQPHAPGHRLETLDGKFKKRSHHPLRGVRQPVVRRLVLPSVYLIETGLKCSVRLAADIPAEAEPIRPTTTESARNRMVRRLLPRMTSPATSPRRPVQVMERRTQQTYRSPSRFRRRFCLTFWWNQWRAHNHHGCRHNCDQARQGHPANSSTLRTCILTETPSRYRSCPAAPLVQPCIQEFVNLCVIRSPDLSRLSSRPGAPRCPG
jgi:hypothetical protein